MTERGEASSLVELRVLDGPNLYFPRAAIKLTLDLTRLVDLPEEAAAAFAAAIGLTRVRPGPAGSGLRQRFALRAVGRLVRQIAARAGTTRLAIRVRPTADVHRLVVAYPWRHLERAEALGRAVAGVLDALPAPDTDRIVDAAAEDVRAAETGRKPPTIRPRVKVVAVTGTNGKTTTSRLIAHMGRCAGLHVGWSSTDGIYMDGELVEEGDYSGPSGAGRVLAHPGVELAVTETARGGILLRGIGVAHNDVSVVTNVSADHLGLQGIDTLDQLAEVKAVVTRITRSTGWCVVNGDDPRTFAMRAGSPGRPWVFSRDPDSPAIREALNEGGRVTTVLDGWVSVLEPRGDAEPLVPIVDVPMTLAGLSRFNVENALAATSAGLGVGLERHAVADGLRSFRPGPELNPGRMNVYSLGGVTVVLDLAHNEVGLEALLEIMNGLRPSGGRLLLAIGTAGDRTDDLLRGMGEIGAKGADHVVIAHKAKYLRGRTIENMERLFREGMEAVGVTGAPAHPTELDSLRALCGEARLGDVVAVMCQAEREQLDAWLREQGATVDEPDTLKRKALAAHPAHPAAP
ncbi:MAG: Mur ligase family protein [Acidimicrobiales bacterium]